MPHHSPIYSSYTSSFSSSFTQQQHSTNAPQNPDPAHQTLKSTQGHIRKKHHIIVQSQDGSSFENETIIRTKQKEIVEEDSDSSGENECFERGAHQHTQMHQRTTSTSHVNSLHTTNMLPPTPILPKPKRQVVLPHNALIQPNASSHQHPKPSAPSETHHIRKLYRCIILNENGEKAKHLLENYTGESAAALPPCLPYDQICAMMNLRAPSRNSKPYRYLFSVLDESDSLTPHLGYLILSGTWSSMVPLYEDTIMNLIGEFVSVPLNEHHHGPLAGSHMDSSNPLSHILYFVATTGCNNLVVVHPDIMLSCTHVANAIYCDRRPFFEVKFKRSSGTANFYAFLGSMLHELYQECLQKKKFTRNIYCDMIDTYLERHRLFCVLNKLNMEQLRVEAENFYDKFEVWCLSWFPESLDEDVRTQANTKTHEEKLRQHHSPHGPMPTPASSNVNLVELTDIEESIWCSTYGMKGKIDVTWQANVSNRQVLYPYEVKSGTFYPKFEKELSHCAQLSLYLLMMSDRYDDPFLDSGAVFYLKDPHLREVKLHHQHVAALLVRRNQVASSLALIPQTNNTSIPPPVPNNHVSHASPRPAQEKKILSCSIAPRMKGEETTCKYCTVSHECMIYHKTVEKGDANSAGVSQEFFNQHTDQVQTQQDVEFVTKWLRLIDLEDSANTFVDREIWSQPAALKEYTHQNCMSNMKIEDVIENPAGRSVYIFQRRKSGKPLTTLDFSVNDTVLVSSQDAKFICLGRGTICKLTESVVHVSSREKLQSISKKVLSFRIDRAHYGGYAAASRENIIHLFVNGCNSPKKVSSDGTESNISKGDTTAADNPPSTTTTTTTMNNPTPTKHISMDSINERSMHIKHLLRNRVVNGHKPRFSPLTESIKKDVAGCGHQLNPHQTNAVQRILCAQDYVLIHGLPGTGKTSSITAAADLLVSKYKKRILVTAFTHSALDNILLKILDRSHHNMRVFRMASNSQHVHKRLHKHILSTEYFLENGIASQNSYIIGCTAASAGSSLVLQSIDFDYCIVDEAGQVTVPVVLGPLRLARKFILIGDPYQLPPLVTNQQAAEGGLKESLLSRLFNLHPEAVCELSIQYRMNDPIMQLSNMLVYNHKLQCGTPELAAARLSLPHLPNFKSRYSNYERDCPEWLQAALNSKEAIVFLNTDTLGECTESRSQDSLGRSHHKIENMQEVSLVRTIFDALSSSGLSSDDVGIISPLNSQVRMLAHGISQEICQSSHTQLPLIQTIDKFQGTERPCIIFSMVRHNKEKLISEVMLDLHRVNVALTRSQFKLIFVGSASTHRKHEPWKQLISHLEAEGYVHDVSSTGSSKKSVTRVKRKVAEQEGHHVNFQSPTGVPRLLSSIRSRKRRKTRHSHSHSRVMKHFLDIGHLPSQKQEEIICKYSTVKK